MSRSPPVSVVLTSCDHQSHRKRRFDQPSCKWGLPPLCPEEDGDRGEREADRTARLYTSEAPLKKKQVTVTCPGAHYFGRSISGAKVWMGIKPERQRGEPFRATDLPSLLSGACRIFFLIASHAAWRCAWWLVTTCGNATLTARLRAIHAARRSVRCVAHTLTARLRAILV
jgi:hypothetical protein